MFFLLFYVHSMKKSVLSLVLLWSLILLAGCGNQSATDTTNEEVTNEETTVTTETNQEAFESTLAKVYKKWGKVTCTMKWNQDGIEMSGVMYLDGKNMRSDMEWSTEWMKFKISTVTKGGYSYTWNNMVKEGMKIAFDEEDMEEDTSDTDDASMSSPMTFSCVKGVAKANAFDLPSDVTFKEMNY